MLGTLIWIICMSDLTLLIFASTVSLNDVNILREMRSIYNTSEECSSSDKPKKHYITCLILARGGSKGIPLKNLAKLNGINLLKRSLTTVFEFGKFDSVWVSTDNLDIAKEAMNGGAQVHWRSAETATDTATSIMAIQEFSSLHPEIDVIALVQCTSPFLKTAFLEEAYSKMQTDEFDSVFSVTREHRLRWKQFPDNSVEPLNFNPKRRPRRQDWEGELVENGMFYFARTSLIFYGLLQGGRGLVCQSVRALVAERMLRNLRCSRSKCGGVFGGMASVNTWCGVVEVPKMYSLEVDTAFDLKLATSLDLLIPEVT